MGGFLTQCRCLSVRSGVFSDNVALWGSYRRHYFIATALIDTGSRMDEVIFEEFKGTGNCELHLDRRLMEKRIFPCLDLNKSGTRKEELLHDPATLNRVWILREFLNPLNSIDAMKFLKDRIQRFDTNANFLEGMNG